MVDIEELYDEVLYIYNDNLEALIIHMSYLLDKKNSKESFKKNKKSLGKIKDELIGHRNLEAYRGVFDEIMDCMKDEIEIFDNLQKLNLENFSSSLYIVSEITKEEEIRSKLTGRQKTIKIKELTEIKDYADIIIKNLKD